MKGSWTPYFIWGSVRHPMEATSLITLFQKLVAEDFFSHPVGTYKICESHLAYVFLTGPFAYKVRKPICIPGLADYSTLEKRKFYLSEEIRLNQVFGHDIYQSIIPIGIENGKHKASWDGEIVDYMLQMKQMPEDSLLSDQLNRGLQLTNGQIGNLATRVAEFHRQAPIVSQTPHAGFKVEAEFFRNSFLRYWDTRQTQDLCNTFEKSFFDFEDVMLRREKEGLMRWVHGDLKLDNIFFAEGQFYIFDRIEFNTIFQRRDVADDVAAVVTDFLYFDKQEWAELFLQEYDRLGAAWNVRAILPYYIRQWAMVNAAIRCGILDHQSHAEKKKMGARISRYLDIAEQNDIYSIKMREVRP